METHENQPKPRARSLHPEERVGKVMEGKYLLEALLGVGAHGAVYAATQLNLERRVAVKLLRSESPSPIKVKRLRREALAIARLRHPNIVTVFDSAETRTGEPFIVMELLQGPTLREEAARLGRLPIDRIVTVMLDVCSAVQAAHDLGVLHRDLKPDNVILDQRSGRPVVKVLDFGTAKLFGEHDSGRTTLTSHRARLGTPLYMSPEQASSRPTDPRSDVYSLACILYELLAGRPPFVGKSVPMILLKHQSEAPKPPAAYGREIPAGLEGEVLRALAKEPADRHQSARELAEAIRPYGLDASSVS